MHPLVVAEAGAPVRRTPESYHAGKAIEAAGVDCGAATLEVGSERAADGRNDRQPCQSLLKPAT